jgi:cell wall-associated NlpC family hydrolase
MIVAGAEKFVGLPFADHGRESDGLDCWGGVRYFLHEMRGLRLPDYGRGYADTGDKDGIAATIRAGLLEGWEKIDRPENFALAIFNIAGKPWHVGVVVGRNEFLHWPENQNSRIERLDGAMWVRRLEGFYRYAN